MSATPGFPTATRRHRSRGARPRSATSAALSCGGADVQASRGERSGRIRRSRHLPSALTVLRAPDLAQRRHQPIVPPSCRPGPFSGRQTSLSDVTSPEFHRRVEPSRFSGRQTSLSDVSSPEFPTYPPPPRRRQHSPIPPRAATRPTVLGARPRLWTSATPGYPRCPHCPWSPATVTLHGAQDEGHRMSWIQPALGVRQGTSRADPLPDPAVEGGQDLADELIVGDENR